MAGPRVLYLCGWPIGSHGEGAASFVYEQIAELAAHVRAAYVEHRFAGALDWARRRASGRDVEPITDLWPERVTARRVWTPRWSPRLTRRGLLDDVWHAGAMVAARVTRAWGGVDLVHAHVVLPAGLLGAAVAQALGVPLVLQEHSGPFEMHLDSEEKRAAVRRAVGRARLVLAVSDGLARRIDDGAAAAGRIHVVPNLVRTDIFAARPRTDAGGVLRVISVGGLHPVKGLDTLLRAIAELRARNCAVHVEIVGDGDMRAALESLVRELGLSAQVSLTGALPRAAVAERLAAAQLYVCSSRHETFGLAPAEALAVGRPVVSTRCGGPEAFVDERCGALVAPDDPRAMADAIVRTWRRVGDFDPVRLHDEIDARFGPRVFRERMLGLYDHVLRDRAAA